MPASCCAYICLLRAVHTYACCVPRIHMPAACRAYICLLRAAHTYTCFVPRIHMPAACCTYAYICLLHAASPLQAHVEVDKHAARRILSALHAHIEHGCPSLSAHQLALALWALAKTRTSLKTQARTCVYVCVHACDFVRACLRV